jgi:hypothetical protein
MEVEIVEKSLQYNEYLLSAESRLLRIVTIFTAS